jgi:hypothetical protein
MPADDLSAPYEGAYLHSDDLTAGPVTVTIAEVIPAGTETDARGQVIKDALLSFKGTDKKLVLNKTNFRTARLALGGAKMGDWPGQKVTLGVRYIDALGQKGMPCIRVLPPDGVRLPYGLQKWFGRPKP